MNWKNVMFSAVLSLLVVVMALYVYKAIENNAQRKMIALEPKAQIDIKARIENYELILAEQQLVTDILKLRYEAALIQAKFQPQPAPPQVKE